MLALDAAREFVDIEAKSMVDLLEQGSLTPQPWRKNPEALGLTESLVLDTPTNFRKRINSLAEDLSVVQSGDILLMGDPPTREEAYRSAFPRRQGITLDDQPPQISSVGGSDYVAYGPNKTIHSAAGLEPAPGPPGPPGGVAFLQAAPKTRAGRKAIARIKADPTGRRIGVRTIAKNLTNKLEVPVLEGREQTTGRNPAHYLGGYRHVIRTRSATSPPWMFHEAGHALSDILRSKDPKFIKRNEMALLDIAQRPGSMASAKSGEEGFAEWTRLYITDPASVADLPITRKLEEGIPADLLDAVQDAARAYAEHRKRPVDAIWRSYMHDTAKDRPFGGSVVSRMLTDLISRGFAPELAMRRAYTEVRKDGETMMDGWRKTAALERRVRDTPSDLVQSYQSILHINQMVGIALEGPGNVRKDAPTGLRVHATGEPGLPSSRLFNEKDLEILEAGGFKLPEAPEKHGDVVVLARKSVKDAISPISRERWDDFEAYAQMKATASRIETMALEGQDFPFQSRQEGVTPTDLQSQVERFEAENPDFLPVFKDLEEIMNASLLVDVMSGEMDAATAVEIRNRWEHYVPLTRQGANGARSLGGGSQTKPTSNIRKSRGSVNAAEPLLMAMARRLDNSIHAYYWNRFAMAPLHFSEQLRRDPTVPRSAKIAASRVALPLNLDTKKAARVTPEELKKQIHAYIVDEVQKGNTLFNIGPEDLGSFSPDDISVMNGFDVWRSTEPKAIRVIAPFVNGERRYYQITDDNLYRVFASDDRASDIVKLGEALFGESTQGLKRQITNTIIFTLRSLARDPLTAIMFGKDPQALIPGFYHAVGALHLITGKEPAGLARPELMSRAFRQVTAEDFTKRRSKMMTELAEGVIPRGWHDMSKLQRTLTMPGIAFRILTKPIEIYQAVTGQRALAGVMESAPRIGAYVMAKKRGLSDEAAQLAADTITGNFAERPLSPSAWGIYRMAGFLNPAIQIKGQEIRFLTDPIPLRAASSAGIRMGTVAAITAMVWAINESLRDDEDRALDAERPEQERLTHANIQGLSVPFDYGILGGVQSWTWNTLDAEFAGLPQVDRRKIAAKMLIETLPHTSFNPIEFLPMSGRSLTEAYLLGPQGFSLYRNRPLVPEYMKYAEASEQAFDTTPDIYKWIGKAAGMSPIKLQYAVRNGLGVQVDNIAKLADRVGDGFVFEELADLPEVGRLFTRDPVGWGSQSVQKADDLAGKYANLRSRLARMRESGDGDPKAIEGLERMMYKLEPVNDAMKRVSKLWDEFKKARASGADHETRKAIEQAMTRAAQDGLRTMTERTLDLERAK